MFLIICFATTIAEAQDGRMERGLTLFTRHVRADLAHNCLKCHGGESVKGDFNLATREALIESGFVGETAADSYVMELLTHMAEPRMPFKQPKLSDESIQHIADWIDLGAPYDKPFAGSADADRELQVTDADRDFWSFRPLSNAAPPNVRNADWCRTEIDRFILAKLEDNGLQPNETADRRVLIRRAYFDLLGLPPKLEEVDSFINDTDPDAWPELIDRLLASPHYGERWARHWMDVARFAESHGYEQDYDRPHAFHYRDFLIKAFNADMPYDQFIRWQLAGDELAPEDPLAMMATGFLGAGVFPTQLTEAEFESARYDELDDMVTTTGVAFLGLSVGCARCHDHKFDPIPTRDYYSLASTFTTTIRSEVELDLAPDEHQRKLEQWETDHAELVSERETYRNSSKVSLAFDQWLKSDARSQFLESDWTVLDVSEATSSQQATTLQPQEDGAILAEGNPPARETYTAKAKLSLQPVRFIRIEALTHQSMKRNGPGRAGNGNFALSDLKLFAASTGQDGADRREIRLVSAKATHEQNAGNLSVASAIDDDLNGTGWAVDLGGIGKDQAAVFELEKPLTSQGDLELEFRLRFSNNGQHSIGRFRLSISASPKPPTIVGSGRTADLSDALAAWDNGKLSPEHRESLFPHFAKDDPQWVKLDQAVQSSLSQKPKPNLATVQVSSEGLPHIKHHADGRGYPHFYEKTHFLTRGDVNQKGDEAKPSFLEVLMPTGTTSDSWKVTPPKEWNRTSFRRATLANWITDTERGAGQLAARVAVNRLWHHHFGRGLVSTPNDFGFTGERPTHPELLDWLAQNLVTTDWQLKRLHKLIMTSSVYMQSGHFDNERASKDRENHFLWRHTPRRLEAEAIRDAMLSVSQQFDPTMYGKGTLDPNMKRRSIYFFIKRSRLIPTMMLFDWPEHLVSIGSRGNTTVAPQALMFMNSPQGRQYATAFARRLPPSAETAISSAYRAALGRSPTDRELDASKAFLASQQRHYRDAGRENADQLAITDLCQTLFSMNEFIYID